MVVFEILVEVVKINIVVMKIFYSLVRGVRLKVRGGFVFSILRFDILGTEIYICENFRLFNMI